MTELRELGSATHETHDARLPVRSLLLAASFPPAVGGVETLLYQTNRLLTDPPLVLAPAPAAAGDRDGRPRATRSGDPR